MALNKRKRRSAVKDRVNSKSYPQLTLEQGLDMVIAGKKAEGVRERTLRDYIKTWHYFTNWLAESYPEVSLMEEVTTEMVRNYVSYLKYEAKKYNGHKFIDCEKQSVGLAETTINIRLRVYRALFNYLEREELVEVNPMDKVKLLRHDLDLTNCFTDEEVKEIFMQPNQKDFVGFRDFVAMNLLLDSGLRIGELINLRISDIDFQTRFITLGGERNKNRKPRLVPISAYVTKLLMQLITENQAHFKLDRIFLSCFGEPISENHFNKRLKYYADKAGITGKKVTAHVYRHTWAKNMTLNGCDAFTLQKMGGWADIRTMRRYIQMDTDEMRRSHDDFSPINGIRQRRK
ncbi:tyrosine-type recombinase/integrase [Priestia megaterium]|uniref:tyrosine-type recombinase/integrase n=1 Tax=Priestia megaterium TaxID=1404 RepID=UPI000BF56A7C|nr:tyrosine-type recombinase/integrase [Priestia megaterium]PFR91313.1 integrase [Priestia megaterium]